MSKVGKRLAVGTLVAAAVGYVAGILTAPKSGRETRKDLQRAASRAKYQAEKKLKIIHSELGDLLDEGSAKAKKLKTAAAAELKKALDTGASAKEKARLVLSAVHEGDADDKDLEMALKEGGKAVEHLRAFLKKKNDPAQTN